MRHTRHHNTWLTHQGGAGFLGRKIVELLVERFADKLAVRVLDAARPGQDYPAVDVFVGDIRVSGSRLCKGHW